MSIHTDHTTAAEPALRSRRRWVKVDVDEELFARLHVRAAESRMRFLPYLRRFLVEAHAYALVDGLAVESSAKGRSAPG